MCTPSQMKPAAAFSFTLMSLATLALGTSIMHALYLFRMDLYEGKKCFAKVQLAWHHHDSGSHYLISWSVHTHPELYRYCYCCQLPHPLLSELLKWHHCAGFLAPPGPH